MNILIIAVGNKPTTEYAKITEEYLRRFPKNISINWKYIKNGSGSIQSKIDSESKQISTSIPKKSFSILLDETGQRLTSEQLSDKLFSKSQDITFIIGGAHGVSSELKNEVDLVWSLSKLVFPHQIVKILLAEQIYRAYTISIGHPYHHD